LPASLSGNFTFPAGEEGFMSRVAIPNSPAYAPTGIKTKKSNIVKKPKLLFIFASPTNTVSVSEFKVQPGFRSRKQFKSRNSMTSYTTGMPLGAEFEEK
jgi:hypothetical protein